MKCDNCGRESPRGRGVELVAGEEFRSRVGDMVSVMRSDFVPFSAWFCDECIRKNRKGKIALYAAGVAVGLMALLIGMPLAARYRLGKLMLGMAGLAFFGSIGLISVLFTVDLKELFDDRLKQLARERTGRSTYWTRRELEKMQKQRQTMG